VTTGNTSAPINLEGTLDYGAGTQGGVSLSAVGNVSFASTSVVKVNTGTLGITAPAFSAAGSIDLGPSARMVRTGGFTNEGLISGSGTIDVGLGTLTNQGTLRPGGAGAAGVLTVQGNVALGATSLLEIELAGTTQYDRLAASGAVTLGGTVAVSSLSPFTPSVGQSFDFVTAGTAPTGNFSSSTLPGTDLIASSTSVSGLSFRLSLVDACAGVCWDGGGYGSNWSNVTLTLQPDEYIVDAQVVYKDSSYWPNSPPSIPHLVSVSPRSTVLLVFCFFFAGAPFL
jgi:hypothetical protein